MKKTFEQKKEAKVSLQGFLSEFRDALEDEIHAIEKSGQSSTLLFGGRQIESHGVDLWYRFNVEYVPSLPADTPCKLVIGKDQFDVTVISFEESSIINGFNFVFLCGTDKPVPYVLCAGVGLHKNVYLVFLCGTVCLCRKLDHRVSS